MENDENLTDKNQNSEQHNTKKCQTTDDNPPELCLNNVDADTIMNDRVIGSGDESIVTNSVVNPVVSDCDVTDMFARIDETDTVMDGVIDNLMEANVSQSTDSSCETVPYFPEERNRPEQPSEDLDSLLSILQSVDDYVTRASDQDQESSSDPDNNIMFSDSSSSSSSSSNSTSSFISSVSDTSDSNLSGPSYDEMVERNRATVLKEQIHIMSKIKPKYPFNTTSGLLYREIGLTGRHKKFIVGSNSQMFHYRLSGSLHSVERLELMYKFEEHKGCVNSLNFNNSGNLLVSGSDDLQIIIWKWPTNEIKYKYDSGHTSNVFQTKFLDVGNTINIVSCARDGQVRHAVVRSSGGKPVINMLAKHNSAVHKLAIPPTSPWEILSAGEDGKVIRYDLRENKADTILQVKANTRKIPLYSIAAHPIDDEFCVCGRDQFVRVYDLRNPKEPTKKFAPQHLLSKRIYSTHITSAVYNYIGTEILASYSENDIYLFQNVSDKLGKYLHKYEGHNNQSTIKGVNFFGPRSEFVMSGSDCANIFFWDKETEAIVQWMPGDEAGVVNCLEPHPYFPVLATSGMDHDIKIWVPSCESPPKMEGLATCIQKNLLPKQKTYGMFDNDTVSLFFRHCLRNQRRRTHNPEPEMLFDDNSLLRDDNDDDDDDDENDHHFRALPCSPS